MGGRLDELTTTSYAILGLVALKPFSTYELAKQMRRNLRFFWPRAESKIYAEPKRLTRLGLVRQTRRYVGKRASTVYAITPAGRRALLAFIAGRGKPPSIEFDNLVRVFFADMGSVENLLATLRAVREDADQLEQEGVAVALSYLGDPSGFHERLHINALMFDLLRRYANLFREWAQVAEAEVSQWHDTAIDDEKAARAMATFQRSRSSVKKLGVPKRNAPSST